MLASTAMACEPTALMDQETAYHQALQNTSTYRVSSDTLELLDVSGDLLLRFTRQQQPAASSIGLLATSWTVTTLGDTNLSEGTTLTLAFPTSEIALGYAGCRAFISTYQLDGSTIRFPSTAMIQNDCANWEDHAEQEGDFTDMLGWASHYSVKDSQLTINTSRGETLTFDRLPTTDSAALEGSTWSLAAMIETNLAAAMPDPQPIPTDRIPATQVTARFDAGALSGAAGCNNYRASYSTDGDTINIGAPAATKMGCQEPAGVMDQETRFLSMLAHATTYHIHHNLLWLTTGDRQALVFTLLPDGEPKAQSQPAEKAAARDCTGPNAFPTGEATLVPPTLIEAVPAEPIPGAQVEVLGRGGYQHWDNGCGQYSGRIKP